MIGQYYAWKELVNQKIFLVGNVAGSFVYVISGLHLAHIVGGLIFVMIMLLRTFQEKVHAKNLLWIEMCTTFWHFLDGLWLYLFFFLILNR
jgi:cytochrome c oxidase subunit 3